MLWGIGAASTATWGAGRSPGTGAMPTAVREATFASVAPSHKWMNSWRCQVASSVVEVALFGNPPIKYSAVCPLEDHPTTVSRFPRGSVTIYYASCIKLLGCTQDYDHI